MLCCVFLNTDLGLCAHAALEFVRIEFFPRFSDYFHLISLKKKKKVNLVLQSGRALPG